MSMANNQADNNESVPSKSAHKKTSNKKVIIIIAVVAGAFVLLGMISSFVIWNFVSDKVTDKTAETLVEKSLETATGSKVDVNTNNGDVSIQTQEGSASYNSSQKLSDDFPTTVPVYTNQDIKGNLRTSNADNEISWMVTAVSKDSTSTVSQFFKDKMAGWANLTTYDYNGLSTISGDQGNIKLVVTVSPETDEAGYATRITYSVVQQK